ncbi:reverse transcriptase domain-containing protein [Tanacetum coccineum]
MWRRYCSVTIRTAATGPPVNGGQQRSTPPDHRPMAVVNGGEPPLTTAGPPVNDGEARTWLDKEPPRSILTWDDLVSKFINQFFPPSKTTYLRNEITTFYQKPNETFNEAWERFKGLLRQCPHHGFSELHQLDTFYNSLNTNDQDALDSAAGGNFLDKMPRDGLAIIESKSKVRYSRSRAIEPRVSTNAPLSTSTPSNSFEFQQLAASLEDKMDIRMSRLEKMISEKNVTTPATVKAVEEVCVTCGSNHNFNNCPLTRSGNDFPVFHDNIHQFQQTAAVGNFVQRNPPNLANQMRPPGFNQPNVQNNQGNQSRYQGNNFNSNQNRGTISTQKPSKNILSSYASIQGVSKMDFENYVKENDAVLKNVQNQGQNLQNQMANVTSLLTSLCDNFKNSASTSNSGTLPSQTITNPRQQINAITTRSGKTLEGPSTPLVPTPNTAHVPPPEEEESIFMEIPKPKAKKTVNVEIQEPNSPRPNSYQSKLPYPERMKVRENDKPSAQHSWFLKMFKQLHLVIGLKDALVEMPKFNKWLSSLLRNKEKLEEIAITTVNTECSTIIMNKVPEKLEDPGKFLIPCALQELNRTSALADFGASINLLPHSIYKQLGLEALTPTRMTLELANRSITHPMGIAEDVVVRVNGFTFLADFVVVNFELDPRVPIILGRPFLRTAKALIDLYEETLTLRVGKEELVYYAKKSEKNKDKHFVHAISVINFLKDDPFSGSTTTHSDDPSPSSSPVKTSDNLEEFADELTLLKKDVQEGNFQHHSNPLFEFDDNFKSSTINPLFDEMEEDVEIKNSYVSDKPVLLNTPLSDKVECFAPEDDNDDTFLAMEVSSNFEEGYFDSEGDVTFLDNLLCLLATYLHKKPKPLSRPQAAQEEIKIEEDKVSSDVPINTIVMPIRITFDNPIDFNDNFSKPKDFKKGLNQLSASITLNSLGNEDKVFKPGILVYHANHDKNFVTLEENSKENISSGTLLVFKESYFLLPPPEPPDECLNFEPNLVMKNVMLNEDFYPSKKMLPLNVKDVNSFTFIIWTFLPYFTYTEESPLFISFRSEDFVFDPGIVTFHFSYLKPLAFSRKFLSSTFALPKDN